MAIKKYTGDSSIYAASIPQACVDINSEIDRVLTSTATEVYGPGKYFNTYSNWKDDWEISLPQLTSDFFLYKENNVAGYIPYNTVSYLLPKAADGIFDAVKIYYNRPSLEDIYKDLPSNTKLALSKVSTNEGILVYSSPGSGYYESIYDRITAQLVNGYYSNTSEAIYVKTKGDFNIDNAALVKETLIGIGSNAASYAIDISDIESVESPYAVKYIGFKRTPLTKGSITISKDVFDRALTFQFKNELPIPFTALPKNYSGIINKKYHDDNISYLVSKNIVKLLHYPRNIKSISDGSTIEYFITTLMDYTDNPNALDYHIFSAIDDTRIVILFTTKDTDFNFIAVGTYNPNSTEFIYNNKINFNIYKNIMPHEFNPYANKIISGIKTAVFISEDKAFFGLSVKDTNNGSGRNWLFVHDLVSNVTTVNRFSSINPDPDSLNDSMNITVNGAFVRILDRTKKTSSLRSYFEFSSNYGVDFTTVELPKANVTGGDLTVSNTMQGSDDLIVFISTKENNTDIDYPEGPGKPGHAKLYFLDDPASNQVIKTHPNAVFNFEKEFIYDSIVIGKFFVACICYNYGNIENPNYHYNIVIYKSDKDTGKLIRKQVYDPDKLPSIFSMKFYPVGKHLAILSESVGGRLLINLDATFNGDMSTGYLKLNVIKKLNNISKYDSNFTDSLGYENTLIHQTGQYAIGSSNPEKGYKDTVIVPIASIAETDTFKAMKSMLPNNTNTHLILNPE